MAQTLTRALMANCGTADARSSGKFSSTYCKPAVYSFLVGKNGTSLFRRSRSKPSLPRARQRTAIQATFQRVSHLFQNR